MKSICTNKIVASILLILCISLIDLSAQEIELVFPTKGSVDITTTPIIDIKINGGYEIDSTSLNPNNPNRDNITYDSINSTYSKAIINLFLQELSDGSDSSRFVASYAGSYGYGAFSDSVNYSISLNSELRTNFEYGLEIKGLRIFDPITSDTMVIDTIINNYFTTVPPPVDLKFSNIENTEFFRCNDSIFVELTAPINNCSPGGNNILTLSKINYLHDSLGGDFNIEVDTISGNCSLSNDGKRIYFKSTSDLSYEHDYLLDINLEKYTADTNQNYQLQFSLYKQVKLNIVSVSNDTTMPSNVSPMLDDNKYFINKGDSLELYTNKVIGDFEFIRWELLGFPLGESSPLVSDSSSQFVKLKFDCYTPSNLTLTAIYKKIKIDTLVLDTIKNNVGMVVGTYTVYNYLDSLTPYKYTFKSKAASSAINICANINSGYNLVGWDGSSELSTKITPCTKLTNDSESRIGGNVNGGGVVGEKELAACPTLTLEIQLHGQEFQYNTLGVHEHLSSFSLFANGMTIPVIFGKSSDFLSTATVIIPRNGLSTFEAVFSAVPDGCMSIPYYEASKSINVTSRVGDNKRGQELGQIINHTVIWDDDTEDCKAVLTLLLIPEKRYINLSLQEKNGQIIPAKKVFGFRSYFEDLSPFEHYYGASKLTYETNMNNEIIEMNYEITIPGRCDEKIYIVPIINDEKYGFTLDSWDCFPGLTCSPVVTSPEENSLEITLTSDKEAIFYYKRGFTLDKIAVYNPGYDNSNDKYKLSDHVVYTSAAGFPNTEVPNTRLYSTSSSTVYPGGSIYFKEADFRFYFSQEIDESSIYDGGIIINDKSGVFLSTWPVPNKDRILKRWDKRSAIGNYIGSNATEDLSISINNDYTGFGEVNEYVAFKTKSKNYVSTTHYNRLGMQFTERLKNTSNQPLFNVYKGNSIQFMTQSPSLYIKADEVLFYQTDEHEAEYQATFFGGYEAPARWSNGIRVWSNDPLNLPDVSGSFKMPGSSYKVITIPNLTWDISTSPNMLAITNIDDEGWVEFGYNITEIDNCEVCGKFLDVIEKVAEDMVGVLPEDWNIPLKLTTSIAKHIDWFTFRPDQDDHWAEGGKVFRRNQHLWGTSNTMYKDVVFEIKTKTPKQNGLVVRLNLRD